MLTKMTLRDDVDDFFNFASEACAPHVELSDLAGEISTRRKAVEQPMRVAFVGRTNAGKSTMMGVIAGSVRPDAGTVSIAGRVLGPGG